MHRWQDNCLLLSGKWAMMLFPWLSIVIIVCLLNAYYTPITSLPSLMVSSVLCGCYYHLHLQVSKRGLSACPGSQLVHAGSQIWDMVYHQRPCSFDCVTTIHHSHGPFISSLFTGGKYQWYLSQISVINTRGIIPVSTLILSHSSELIHHFRSTWISNTLCFPIILTSSRGEKVVSLFKPEDIGAAYSHILHTVVHLEKLPNNSDRKGKFQAGTHG